MTPLKVLLVDDVDLFLELEKTFFRREGLAVLVARNGQEAIDMVRAERPHLVFMDLYMPLLGGEEACQRIKADPELRTTPVVMVTQGGREEDIERCRRAGCDEIVFKPINRSQFLETARRFLHIATRNAPRIEARLRVQYGDAMEHLLDNFSINLSTGGLFLETAEPLEEGSPLYLEFHLPGRSIPIRCNGLVAWVNGATAPQKPLLPGGVGVQFTDLGLADLQLIREFVKTQAFSPA